MPKVKGLAKIVATQIVAMTVDSTRKREVIATQNVECSSEIEVQQRSEEKSKEGEPEYSPQPEEEKPEYSPQSDEEFDEDMYDENNDDIYGDDFVVNCGIVSVLPAEYDMVYEVSETEGYFVPYEIEGGKPLCYYVMNSGVVGEQKAMFERPNPGMMYHLKPLLIRAKADEMAVNKVFVDEGVAVNLMPYTLFKKMGKADEDLRQHNMVLSNYKGKTSNIMRVVQIDLAVGTTTRSTIFMVIDSKANFNLLLGREWIHKIGVVPSTVHQRLIIWRKDDIVENIEADQRCYWVDVRGSKRSFDKHLENITPCDDESGSYTSVNTGRVLNLDPDHGFIWDNEEDT